MASESRAREQTVRRNIELKKRVLRDLIRPAKDRQPSPNAPYNKFASHKAIIRSIDDSTYPRVDESGPGISSWFRLEFFDLYHNGIEFILRIEYALVDQNGLWDLVPYDYQPRRRDLSRIKIWHNACVPFRNIVEIDTLGDEYYAEPHIYCRFADGGQPYEEFRYRLCGDMYPSPLAPEDRRPLDELDSANAEQNAPADTQRDACG